MEDEEEPTKTSAKGRTKEAGTVPNAEDFMHQDDTINYNQQTSADNWAENLTDSPPTYIGGTLKCTKGNDRSYAISGVQVTHQEYVEAKPGNWITANAPESLLLADLVRHNDKYPCKTAASNDRRMLITRILHYAVQPRPARRYLTILGL